MMRMFREYSRSALRVFIFWSLVALLAVSSSTLARIILFLYAIYRAALAFDEYSVFR